MLALLLAALDQTIVGTAMPRVVAELQGIEHYAWVTTAYMLSSTVVVPIAGKLSDLYGRKPFLVGGIVAFIGASALCGASQSMVQLVLFRGLQGLGAGFLTSMAFTSVGDLFPPARRGRVQGLFGAVFGLASIVGPLLGGYLTDVISWRWVFYVNLPVGVLALAAVAMLYPHLQPERREHAIDYAGAATMLLAVVPLLLALSWGGREHAWTSPQILGLVAFGLIMGALFLYVERRAAEPMIPLDLFGNSIVSISVLVLALTTMSMFGVLLFVPLFIQAVIGTSATTSGTALIPMTMAMILLSIVSGQFISHTGRYRLAALVGIGAMAVGMALLAAMGADAPYELVIRNMVVMGVGLGVAMPIFTLAVQNAVPWGQLGAATSLTQFARSIGGTIGVALFGSLLTNRYSQAFHAALDPRAVESVPPALLAQLENPEVLLNPSGAEAIQQSFSQLGANGPALFTQMLEAVRIGLAAAIHDTFLLGTAVILVAWVTVWFLRELPLRTSYHTSERPSADGEGAG